MADLRPKLSVVIGLVLLGLGIAVFLLTVMVWDGGDILLPASVLAGILVASGLGLILRSGWWLDRTSVNVPYKSAAGLTEQ